MRIAAIADLHYDAKHPVSRGHLFEKVAASADVLLICGDLTASGRPEEARAMVQDLLAVARIPTVAVLGNHDVQGGKSDEILHILLDSGIRALDGDGCEIGGVGFAGAKGFGGGYDRRTLEPWGEESVKGFVREAVDEALKLESALSRLQSERRVALLHYSPIRANVEGECPEVFPFLGSSRLEEPLDRYSVAAAFHGHAHHGAPEGRTKGGVPVYNVALAVLEREFPDRPAFRLVEIAPVVHAEKR
jgi:Icc-related predicted phosphoesterase